jgi:hypothetical protein
MTKEEQQLLQEKYLGLESSEFEEDRKRQAKGEPHADVIWWEPFIGVMVDGTTSRPSSEHFH